VHGTGAAIWPPRSRLQVILRGARPDRRAEGVP